MYSILIVDDEKLERNGIKSLISKYELPFEVMEANNGRDALHFLQNNAVDILFTDIKMPSMDGIELSKHARALRPGLKIIIFSAYGEFDYAKQAIGLNVSHYILKPIDVDEFQTVMLKVIQQCNDEENTKKNQEKLLLGYEKSIVYEREKVLFRLLNDKELNAGIEEKAINAGLDFLKNHIQMIFIDCSKRFFDVNEEIFKGKLKNILKYNYDCFSLNEQQFIIFMYIPQYEYLKKSELSEIGKAIKDFIEKGFELSCFTVIGRLADNTGSIHEEYNALEQVLEYRFFIEGSAILFVEDYMTQNIHSSHYVDEIVNKTYKFIEMSDRNSIRESIGLLYEYIKNTGGLSSIYVKHIFILIIKKILDTNQIKDIAKFSSHLETIYTTNNIGELKDIMTSIINDIYTDSSLNVEEDNRKVIEQVLSLINNEYPYDLSVEYIADKVYMSPNYLGHLFKKQMGINITRYIMEFRLSHAKELLETTNLKVNGICKETGFSSNSYFIHLFRNYFGITPAQYRERI